MGVILEKGDGVLDYVSLIWIVTRLKVEISAVPVLNSYDPREDKWTVLAEMSTARALAGCTVFKNKIFVIGK